MRRFIVALLLLCFNQGLDATNGTILFMMQSGDPTKAIELYKQQYQESGQHDFELLQQIATILLDQGYRSRDPEVQVLTLFGAGISANESMAYILEAGLNNPNPQIQMIALNFLANFQSDAADEAINRAMSSNSLPIRLEIAFCLAKKKYPTALGQAETLMHKMDRQLWVLFPQIFAMLGDPRSIAILRRLMNDPNEEVRIEAILNAARFERDDLLPQIRNLSTHLNNGQQEACAVALGTMRDEDSIPTLEEMAHSSSSPVRLAAWTALYRLGKKEYLTQVLETAREHDPFAISALGEMEGSEETLFQLMNENNLQVRINAALALLERQDPRCLKGVAEVLLRDARDLAFIRVTSRGRALSAWKAVPSAQQVYKDTPLVDELSTSMRESTLEKALDLPEKDFLLLAHSLFERQQNDLVPTLVGLLENLHTPAAIDLLKLHLQKVGAPLVRNYCNLALFRMKESGPYADNLRRWITSKQDLDLIQFRPLIPWEMRFEDNLYQLTAKETSQLLIESIEALAAARDDSCIETLLEAIQNGNAKNKYALTGLLMRSIQ
jgi:HEAT repeat protein